MFIFFFIQWLRKPIWGYPLLYLCTDMLKVHFWLWHNGGTTLPDTGKTVVPWVILDWWTSQKCGGQPEKELWFVTTGWQSRIWPVRMGRRSCNEPVPAALTIGAEGCVIVRIFFRETGILVHISSWMKIIIPMSVPWWKTGCSVLHEICILRIHVVFEISCFSMASRVGSSTNKVSHGLGLIVIRVKMGITYTQKKDWLTHAKNKQTTPWFSCIQPKKACKEPDPEISIVASL